MTVSITHATVATLPDEPGAEINKDQWNEGHSITGLGSAAEADSADFATAAQGALADTALQPGDPSIPTTENVQDLVGAMVTDSATIDFTYDDALGTITAIVKDASITYAKIQNVSATDKGLGRISSGAGPVEEFDLTAAGRALLDDANAAAQRTTLGLGTLATQNGTFSGTSSGTNTGDQTITLTGDVTGSGTGSFAATIANDAVTYAKMQNVSAASRLIGRGSAGGAGDPEEISLVGLSMSGTTLSASGPPIAKILSAGRWGGL